MIQKDS